MLLIDLWANHRLSVLGTLRKNKVEIPPELIITKGIGRPVFSSMFAYGNPPNKSVLCSYVPKRGKNVLLLSTMHDGDDIDPESDTYKPEMVTLYNSTKGGVDVADRS